MKNHYKQSIKLPAHQSPTHQSTDPHFSSRIVLTRELCVHLVERSTNNEHPDLFVSAWLDSKKQELKLRLAVPNDDYTSARTSSLEDVFEDAV